MSDGSPRRAPRALADLVAVGATLLFIASYFPRSVMLSPTITNGGDMGSHYYPTKFLHDVLLPKGQVVGWDPGNYCGYPLFQLYFPLPFLLMVGMSGLVPLTVAFKLGTVLGVFLTPVCAYLGMRLLDVPFPGPALGAVATLCFLFMEANSMWGGNVPSTLAGEFALSLGLALALLFFGAVARAARTGRGVAWVGLLEAAIGLSHGYTLLWTGFGSLLELVAVHRWWRRLGVLVCVHGLALLLMAFWLVGLVWYAPWTTAYNYVWAIHGWRELVPPILLPVVAVAVATGLAVGVAAIVRREPYPRGLATLWGLMLVASLFFLTAHSFHVVDIRFVPFVQLALCLAAGAGLGHLLGRLPGVEVWPVMGAMAVAPWVQSHVTYIPKWISWNYSGYEAKGPWPIVQQISRHLRGDFRDPRVAFEHSPDNEALGTVRIFESLPLFSGRSTLEGLHMQGSPTAPFVFYVQSEISRAQTCPFPDWGCSRTDLVRGVAHLRMMNVSQLIVRSPQVKQAVRTHPGLEQEATFGEYEIWRVRENDGRYAVPLRRAPYLVLGARWKEAAFQWFKRATPDDPLPVFAEAAAPRDEAGFASVVESLPEEPPERELGPVPVLTETLDTDRIAVSGCRPGHPVLVRISYHPRWRSTTGERVWLAGPSFMLVFPEGERFELVFGEPPAMRAAAVASWLGVALLVLAVTPLRRLVAAPVAAAGRALAGVPPLRQAATVIARGAAWSPARRRLAVVGLVAAGGVVLAVAALAAWRPSAEQSYRSSYALVEAGKLDEALPGLRAAEALAPLSTTAVHATYLEATIHVRQGRWAEAEEALRRLVSRFPEAATAPDARYQIGLARSNLGDRDGAIAAWEAVRAEYPDSPSARSARDRLREAGALP